MPAKLTNEKINIIKSRIKENISYSDIAQEIGVSKNCVFRYAKELGINTGAKFKRKHRLNENVFDVIDTEEKAYWLGFIVADGATCYTTTYYKNNLKPNRFYINLSIKDINHLEKLKSFLSTESNIETYIPKGTYSKKEMCKLIVNSTTLCKGLWKYGIVPAKTGIEQFPKIQQVPDTLMKHFIRGFFDGDGSIYKHSDTRSCIQFTGNYSMLSDLKHFLMNHNIVHNNCKIVEDSRGKNACTYHFSKQEDVNRFYDYIYSDATVFLERKYNKFGNSLC